MYELAIAGAFRDCMVFESSQIAQAYVRLVQVWELSKHHEWP